MKNYSTKSFIGGLLIGSITIAALFTALNTKSVNALKDASKQASYNQPKTVNASSGYRFTKLSLSTEEPTDTGDVTTSDNTDKTSLQSETDKKALDIMQKTGNWKYVEPLFPSMSSEGVQAVVNLYIQKTGNYKKAESASKYINKTDSSKSTEAKSKSDYDSLASETMDKTGDIHSIMAYIPHMNTEKVDELVKAYIEKTDDFNSSYAIRQYMSTNGIDAIVQSYVDKTGDYGTIAAMLQFMSADASNSMAAKYINEAPDQQYKKFFLPYLQE